MVARLVRDPFDREGWLFELKWDGFRAIAEQDHGGHISLYSRNRNDFKKRFPPIVDALEKLKRPAILDGEIVALDDHGHARFEWLVNRGSQKGTLVYYVFDVLMLDGKDLRSLATLETQTTPCPTAYRPSTVTRGGIHPKRWPCDVCRSVGTRSGGHCRKGRADPLCRRTPINLALAENQRRGKVEFRQSKRR
jgi:ATP dependent DNA ligase domain